MNSKTVLTATLGAIAGLGLAMGTMLFAQNTNHMGNYQPSNMMGQTTAQTPTNLNTYDSMHGKTVRTSPAYENMHGTAVQKNTPQTGGMMGQAIQQHHTKDLNTQGNMHQPAPVTTHHANYNQSAKDTLCHSDTVTKSGAKT